MTSILNQKNDILEQIFTQLKKHFSEKEQATLQIFINSVYQDVPLTDLIKISQENLNGLTVSLWREISVRKGPAAKIKVFNPDVEQDEWQSLHTVISVLCRNVPFVIDTLKLLFKDLNIKLHRVFYSEIKSLRNKAGKLTSLSADSADELLLYFEIVQTSASAERENIQKIIENALFDVDLVVDDFSLLTKKVSTELKWSQKDKFSLQIDDIIEQQTFLTWLLSDHFCFIGSDQFIVQDGAILGVENSQLGLLKRDDFLQEALPFEYFKTLKNKSLIHFSKASKRAMVHRSAYLDVIYIKRFNEQGELLSGLRIVGLYTSSVYSGSPKHIPIVRHKIDNVLLQSGYSQGSHYFKELTQILYTFPVEDLLLCNEKTLLNNVVEVLHVQERKEFKLFMRCTGNKQFVIATLYVPRDIYNTKVRLTFERLICRTLEVEDIDFQTYLSESNLARLRVEFRLKSPLNQPLEEQAIEKRMKQLTKRWDEELHDALIDQFGEEVGVKLSKKYNEAFPTSYQDSFSSRVAVTDIERIDSLYHNPEKFMALHFYRSMEANSSELKLKLFHQNGALLLSDLIPILENMGLKVAEEYPYKVTPYEENSFWLYDFTLLYSQSKNFNPEKYRDLFADAFLSVWYAKTDNDSFNKLILGAGLTYRDIEMLRAYAKYLKQLCFGFSHFSIAKTLLVHNKLVKEIVALFNIRFDPNNICDLAKQEKLQQKILTALNDVSNLNEDRVLRKYVELIMATVRCNYFQQHEGKPHDYLSFKFDHNLITDIPLPRLNYEIFVYSPRIEGVHLRGGKVARGGLRWSDRGEDFRTEVLGLVKAQQVKNSVIVPVGAKGGFVAKKLNPKMDRETFMAEGISCYKIFINALLSLTDNIEAGKVIPPLDVVRYDSDDPYLVVAADKGTATFSDIANKLATDKHFWLNDAFASGGSNGYDHKKMGITARGAWISVQRHFRSLEIDVQTVPISVIGIGDMAGDVFGNGMLSSKCISLLGAFNHLHIFIDPSPKDLEISFNERLRLFETPRTGWNDYDKNLISQGGGVFERSAKSIKVSPEMAKRFDIYQKQVTPAELITLLLKAQVDLLWNGGIGTYVKGEMETHGDVGDKANDLLRINGAELRCSVIGEGGNLGFTQCARIEYAHKGGLCFTDAIDNAAGVNCSDLEVNIKILLDRIVSKGDLTVKQRNVWLVKMTDEIAQLVLVNNYRQAQSISLSYFDSDKRIEEYRRLIVDLEEKGKLNRTLEFIPSDEELNEYKSMRRGLTRPSIAVMLSYAKNELKEALAIEKVADDPYLLKEAEKIFPASLVKQYKKEIHQHPLVGEIVATQISNDLFNCMGPTFTQRMMASVGCSFLDVCKAWVAARDIFSMTKTLQAIEALDNIVSVEVQSILIERLKRMVRHATRWLVRNHRSDLDTGTLVKLYQAPLASLVAQLDSLLIGSSIENRQTVIDCLVADNVPHRLAASLASSDQIYAMLGVISIAKKVSIEPEQALQVYFHSGESLKLFGIGKQLNLLPGESYWQSLAREAMRDDLEWQQLRISRAILEKVKEGVDISDAFVEWHTSHHILSERWQRMADSMLAVSNPEFSMCQVALRKLLDLSQN
ncbi:MAG: NAD-glutamate dehydrogenase [Psychromonas sp.]